MVTLYFAAIHEEIKEYTLECSETKQTFKSLDGTVFGRNTFKKIGERHIQEGYFHGSWFIYSTNKDEIKNMIDTLYIKAVSYHNGIISRHQKTLVSLGVQYENKDQK